MRPYLAIIKDSFREAFATYILWVTLAAITLFLLVLIPIGFDEDLATQLRESEINNWPGLLAQLRDQGKSSSPSPGKHLWTLLPDDQKKAVDNYLDRVEDGPGPPGGRRLGQQRRLLEGLNKLIANDDFYDEDSWAKIETSDDLKAQAASPAGSDKRKAAHRRLMAAAYSRYIDLNSEGAVYAKYLWLKMDEPLPFTPDNLNEVIRGVLSVLVSLLFGWIGILISILVTASIIPRTFEPGEITLLLSKPVSRSLLFLSRFCGGCAFTFVNVAYLMCGIWLIAGLRFGIWNHSLLWGIPLYVFLFAIYFSVSAYVGVRSGNAIIAVAFTIVFSLFLWSIYTVKGTCELFLDPQKIVEIVPTSDGVIAVNAARDTMLWDAGKGTWEPVFTEPGDRGPQMQRRVFLADSHFLPRFDEQENRLVAMKPSGAWASNEVLEGRQENQWIRQTIGQTSDSVMELFIDPSHRIICVGSQGIYAFSAADPEELERQKILESASGGFWKPATKTGTRSINPESYGRTRREDAVAMNPVSGDLYLYRAGKLEKFPLSQDGNYSSPEVVELTQKVAEGETPQAAVVGAGQQIIVAYESGKVEVAGTDQLYPDALQGEIPRRSVVSNDGRYVAVLTHSGRLWLYDAQEKKPASTSIPAQGNISAVSFNLKDELLLADRYTRVRTIDPASGELVQTMSSPDGWLARIYHWGVSPLYLLLPKPSELNNVVTYFMTEKDSEVLTMTGEQSGANLQQERSTLDTWTPIWTSLAFMAFMLALSCWHISSRDF